MSSDIKSYNICTNKGNLFMTLHYNHMSYRVFRIAKVFIDHTMVNLHKCDLFRVYATGYIYLVSQHFLLAEYSAI